jgi:membrane-associated phospholipid phosphatase
MQRRIPMHAHGHVADSIRAPWSARASIGHACRPAATPGTRRALEAASASILCFAAIHVLIRIVDLGLHRDASSLNLFTMLEAQRLWPALASGSAAAAWSLAAALAVYGIIYFTMTRPGLKRIPRQAGRRSVAGLAPGAGSHAARNGVSTNGHAPGARLLVPAERRIRVSPIAGLLALVGGLGVHMGALALIEKFVRVFPPLPDVVHQHLPYVNFGWPGEVAYAGFLLVAIAVLFRTQPGSVPVILALLGLFYAVRGVFLFLMPIGVPPTAPPVSARFVFWPFPGHAYFPGGHTGMMTVISLSVVSTPWRRALLAFTFVFAIGTLLARTHYSADALGGWLVAYAIVLCGRRHFSLGPRTEPGSEEQKMAAARQPEEVLS